MSRERARSLRTIGIVTSHVLPVSAQTLLRRGWGGRRGRNWD
jgi:hypothetical protein